jgi:hypothetical protein
MAVFSGVGFDSSVMFFLLGGRLYGRRRLTWDGRDSTTFFHCAREGGNYLQNGFVAAEDSGCWFVLSHPAAKVRRTGRVEHLSGS